MRTSRPSLVQCLGYAVSGELLEPVGTPSARLVADVVALLEQHGRGATRLREEVARMRAAGRPWPHPLPDGWLASGEHARYAAALQELLTRLGLHRVAVARSGVQADRRDTELTRERPPHW